MKYNERIREIREDNSLTQQKIADLLHIGQRTYADYESGKTRIPIDSLLILARFYDVSLDYITGASNIKSEYPYTMKDILEDTEKTEQKKQELENILEQYNELISIYKAKIEEMLR